MSDLVVRRNIAKNLDTLANLLEANRVLANAGPLRSAASQCRNHYKAGKWGYDLDNLIFRKLGNLKRIPSEADEIEIEVSLSIEGLCESNVQTDPLTKLEFNIHIFGKYMIEESEDVCKVVGAWHLDRHQQNVEDNPPEFSHPLYHFQYGGRYLKDVTDDHDSKLDFGSALICESPRLPHPPLDAILGVDFVLTNFIGSNVIGFREEGEYINLLRPIQERLWKPYIEVLAANWRENAHLLPWPSKLLWPQLLLPVQ